jgi:hypothetical protein
MEGIHILNQTTITTASNLDLAIAIISFIGLVLFFRFLKNSYDILGKIILLFLLLLFCCGSTIKYCTKTSYQQYQVTIDNNVSIKEFYNKYKIVSHEGQIYTIQERKTK